MLLGMSLIACSGVESQNKENTEVDKNTFTGVSEENAESVENSENTKTYEDTFTGLSEYIVQNGKKSEIEGDSCYTVLFEIEDSYAFGEIKLSAITNGTESEYKSICVQGSTYNYPGSAQDYATLIINADGTFTYETDFKGSSTHSIYTYEVSVNADSYTNKTEFVCLRYNADTNELLETADAPEDNNYGRNKLDLNNLLDRTAISLVPIGLSVNSLGFTSYEPDMKRAEHNKTSYDGAIDWEQKQEAEKDAKNAPPKIGMTKDEVLNGLWGTPDRKNIDEYSWGTHEQWVYDNLGYVYFEDGIVTSISRNE